MSLRRAIAKNTFIQVGGKIIGMALSLIAAGMTFRYLSAAGFGRYTAVLSFLQFFGTVMDFGLYIILIKKIARITEETLPTVNSIFTLRIVSGVVFLGSAPVVAWLLGRAVPLYADPEILRGILLTTLFYFCISLNQLLSAVFQKFLNTSWIALGELLGKAVLLIATIAVIAAGGSLLWMLGVLVASSAVNFLVNWIGTRRYIHLRLQWNAAIMREILREAWPIALSIGLVLVYFKGDVLLLTLYNVDAAVIGWYGAPYKLLEVLITFPAMFTGLVLPLVTEAWQRGDRVTFQRVLQRAFDALVIIALPIVAGLFALAPLVMRLLAGEDFTASTPILRILVFATCAIFITTLFGYVVPALDQQRRMLWGYAFVAVTALIGYLTFIPRFSIYGAAAVTVYSETAVLVISAWIVLRTSHISLRLRTTLLALFSACVMFGALALSTNPIRHLFTFHSASFSLATQLILLTLEGAVIYGTLMIVLRAVPAQELRELFTRRP